MDAFDWSLARMRSLHLYFGGWSESNPQNRGARCPKHTTSFDFKETYLKLFVLTHRFRKRIVLYTSDALIVTYDL